MRAMRPHELRVGVALGALPAVLGAGAWQPAEATHFRYGSLSWRPLGGNTVEFTLQNAWRRSNTPSFDDCVNPGTGAVIPRTGAGGSRRRATSSARTSAAPRSSRATAPRSRSAARGFSTTW